MKIQGMAIIFIIIILPITIVVGEYAATQVEIFRLEQLFDSRLITATDDALKAFQINTFNDAYSSISNSKIESIEASVNAFYNSMVSSFGMQGYSGEELLNYVPALVYTMYDGYYIYSPYTNVADISEGTGLKINLDSTTIEYGLKPYVYYSCRYTMANSDFIINYSLDNYITVQGIIDGNYVYKSGYLLTIDRDEGVYVEKLTNGSAKYYYAGQEILPESDMEDWLLEKDAEGNIISKQYKYIKLNDVKYYWDEPNELIFYLAGETRVEQAKKSKNEDKYNQYINQIQLNRSAINYYKSAYEFTSWVKENLGDLKLKNAVTEVPLSGNQEDKIFIVDDSDNKIEYTASNFNLHRKEVIRYSIESNLSTAIANFNSYTNSSTSFQMPKLKETEWDLLQNEVSIISFLQGLNLGGKLYNGYTVVSNSKTEEVITEDSIYITTNDGYYHRINAEYFDEDEDIVDTVLDGVLNLDFETRKDGATGLSYRQKREYASYTSIVGQEKINTDYDSIYEYLDKESVAEKVKQIYYTALGRERWSTYQTENSSNILEIISQMTSSNDYEIVTDGLIRHYEATNIDGKGNTIFVTTEWTDLSGHYDGIINGATVNNNYISFDGTNDYVNLGEITGLNAVTAEVSFYLNSIPEGNPVYILDNFEDGGFGIYVYNGKIGFQFFNEKEERYQVEAIPETGLETSVKYHVVGTYDGNYIRIYINGNLEGEIEATGKIKNPLGNAPVILGAQPNKDVGQSDFANIYVHSAKIYDRALSEDEVVINYDEVKGRLPQFNKPSISITSVNISPNKYISNTQKPILSAVVKVDSEDSSLQDVKYVFTKDDTAPESGWTSLNDKISAEGKLDSTTLAFEATSEGIWRLYVKATNARGEKSSYALFDSIQEDITPPEINIQLEHSSYEIAEGETSINVYAAVWATDDGTGVATLRAIYTTTATTPSDEVFENQGQDMLISNPIGNTIETEGTYYLHAKVTDLAGNEDVKSVEFAVTKAEVEEVTYNIEIEDTDGKGNVYNLTQNVIIKTQVKKSISVTASNGNTEDLTIQYSFVEGTASTEGTPIWKTGTTVEEEVGWVAEGCYYYLRVRVLDAAGNEVTEQVVKRFTFNGETYIV